MWPFSCAAKPTLCETCRDCARAFRLQTVYVYPNGHILGTAGSLPGLSEWPMASDPRTFCGLGISGMGASVRYRMTGRWAR